MAFNYWVYQERDVPEPWAIHVWLFDDCLADLSIYAEWLPYGAMRIVGIPATFENFVDTIEEICENYGHPLTLPDMKQLNSVWVKMSIKAVSE